MAVSNPYSVEPKASMSDAPIIFKTAVEPESMWDSLTSIWNEMGTSVSGAWNTTEQYISESWDTTKLTAYGAYLTAEENIGGVIEGAKNTFSDALSLGDSWFSWIQGKLLFILGVSLLVFFVLAKTGILPQIADTVRAIYGG